MNDFDLFMVDRNDLEYLAVEISHQGQRLCQIYREEREGLRGELVIEFLSDLYILDRTISMRFPLSKFFGAVQEATMALDAAVGSG